MAGGAPVNPESWTAQASVRVNGANAASGGVNVTVAPTQSTFNDYSTNTSTSTNTFSGGQTNVSAQGNLANGGTFTVTTESSSPAAKSASDETENHVTRAVK
jgi:hypothetical protein